MAAQHNNYIHDDDDDDTDKDDDVGNDDRNDVDDDSTSKRAVGSNYDDVEYACDGYGGEDAAADDTDGDGWRQRPRGAMMMMETVMLMLIAMVYDE